MALVEIGKMFNDRETFEERFDRSLIGYRVALSIIVTLNIVPFLGYTSHCSVVTHY